MDEATSLRFYESLEPYGVSYTRIGARETTISLMAEEGRPPVPVLRGTQPGTLKSLSYLPGTIATSLRTSTALPNSSDPETSSTSKEQCLATKQRTSTFREQLQFIWNKLGRWFRPVQQPQPPPQPLSSSSDNEVKSSTTQLSKRDQPQSNSLPSPTTSALSTPADGGSDAVSRTSLDQIPDELLMQVMELLEPADLYLLRQVSSGFARLFGDRTFARHHESNRTRCGLPSFAIESVSENQRQAVASCIQKDLYCRACLEARCSPNWTRRLSTLRDLLHCDGCDRKHPKFLFYPEDIAAHEQGSGQLLCVGRLGRVSLCSHRTPRTTATWRTYVSIKYSRDRSVCTHPSHQPGSSVYKKFTYSAFPRMELSVRGLFYWWDLPLLDMDKESMPSLDAVHDALHALLDSALNSHKVCKHMLQNGNLRSFIRPGICKCFVRAGHCVRPFSKNERPDCFCSRERYLTCVDCGSACAWYLDKGQLGLSYRYIWKIDQPTSAAWLAFLDQDSYADKLFKENTRNIFWCDTPRCVVANGRRWEAMIKQNTIREKAANSSLYQDEAQKRAEATGYRFP